MLYVFPCQVFLSANFTPFTNSISCGIVPAQSNATGFPKQVPKQRTAALLILVKNSKLNLANQGSWQTTSKQNIGNPSQYLLYWYSLGITNILPTPTFMKRPGDFHEAECLLRFECTLESMSLSGTNRLSLRLRLDLMCHCAQLHSAVSPSKPRCRMDNWSFGSKSRRDSDIRTQT